MMQQPHVPDDIKLPEDADAELQAHVDAVNEFLGWAREHMLEEAESIKKIQNMRSSGGVYQGVNGMVIF